jgi:outer membrane protein assembly factor BamB
MVRICSIALAAALFVACAAEGLPILGGASDGNGGSHGGAGDGGGSNGGGGANGGDGGANGGDGGANDDGGTSSPSDFALPTTGPTRAVNFRIDAAHTGGQPRDHLTLPLSAAWTHEETKGVIQVLVADGRVFVLGGLGALTALDTKTGAILWGPKSFSDMWAGAYDESGVVYVLGHLGFLTAVDAATGTTKWMMQVPSATMSFNAPPLAADGKVFVNADYKLTAIAGATGAILWTAGTGSGNDGMAAHADGVVYLANSCARTVAFDANSGKQLWLYQPTCGGGGGTAPAVYAHDVYVRSATGNLVFDAATGKTVGTFAGWQPPSFIDRVGYFPQQGLNGDTLQAVDLDTGSLLWAFTGDGELNSAPIACAGNVFVGSARGNLYGLDTTGNVAWMTYLGLAKEVNSDPERQGMVIAEGTLFVPAGTTLFAFR